VDTKKPTDTENPIQQLAELDAIEELRLLESRD
jgi:hypothetical protein